MIIPLLAYLAAVLLVVYFAFSWDKEDRKCRHIKQNAAQVTIRSILTPIFPCLRRENQVTPEHNTIELTTMNHQEGSGSAISTALSSEELILRKEQKRRERKAFQEKLKGKSVGSEHSILDDALPEVFRSNTYIEKLTAELKRHHRWFNILYHYSDAYPRVWRALALATKITTTIFFIAITYSLANPDDNECHTYINKDDCLVPQSHFRTGQPQCRWDNNAMECSFVQPSILIRVILFVVIFAVMLAIPVNIVTDYLIQYVLAAPLKVSTKGHTKKQNAQQKYLAKNSGDTEPNNDAALTIPVYSSGADANDPPFIQNDDVSTLEQGRMKPLFDTNPPADSPPHSPTMNSNNNEYQHVSEYLRGTLEVTTVTTPLLAKYKSHRDNALRELELLQKDVRKHRELYVTGVLERRKFDRLWGLTSSGHFILPESLKSSDSCTHRCVHHMRRFCGFLFTDPAHIRVELYGDVLRTLQAERIEIARIKALSLSQQEVGRMLLLHLHIDLLPTTTGNILACKGQRDHPIIFPVNWFYKLIAALVIVGINGYFLYTLFAFASTQSDARCTAWFKSFMLFVVMDCVGLATNRVLSTHVLVPCLALSDVQRVKEYLINKLQQHDIDVQKTALLKAQLGKPQTNDENAVAALHTKHLRLAPPATAAADLESGACNAVPSTVRSFNAAAYLYTSHRLSAYFPTLYETQIVQLCILQLPRRAQFIEIMNEMNVIEAEKRDHSRSSTEKSSCTCNLLTTLLYVAYVCVMPCVHLVILLPLCLQDALLDYITIVLFGYLLLLHILLYAFYPPLAFVPPFVGSVLAHFYIVSGNAAMQTKLANLKKQTLAARQEQRKLNNRRIQQESGGAKNGGTKVTPYEVGHTRVIAVTAVSPTASTAAGPTNKQTTTTAAAVSGSSTSGDYGLQTAPVTASPHKKSIALPPQVLDLSGGSEPSSPHSSHTKHSPTKHSQTHGAHSPSPSPTNTGANVEEKDARLKHFLTSADKVLHSQEEHVHHSATKVATTPTHITNNTAKTNGKEGQQTVEDKSDLNSSTTSLNTSFNTVLQVPNQQSWSNLRAVDSFNKQQQQQQGNNNHNFTAVGKNSPSATASSPNKANRLVKKASRPANTLLSGAEGGAS